MSDFTGKNIERYHLIAKLGEGGMAVVYKAYDARLEREVAIKFIRVDMVQPAMLGTMLKRFEREAKSLARMKHPYIINIYDYGEYEGEPYLVMEYVPGGTLKYTIKPCSYKDAVKMLIPIAEALAFAHERGVVHRDVKPANILIAESGQPMLSDFGIAKVLESDHTVQLTGTGMGIGTPEYMAPEQWQGKPEPASDIYALGVVLYELVTGKKPYTADTPASVFAKVLTEPLPKPKSIIPQLPDEVEKVILKALEKDPGNRYGSMAVFAEALEALIFQEKTLPVDEEPASPTSTVTGETFPLHSEDRTAEAAVAPPIIKIPQESKKVRSAVRSKPLVQDEKAGPETSAEKPWWKEWYVLAGGGLIAVASLIVIVLAISSGMFSGDGGDEVAGISTQPEETKIIPSDTSAPALVVDTSTNTSQPSPAGTQTVMPTATRTPTITLTPTPTLGIGSTMVSPKDGMVLVYVPEGEFEMGSEDGREGERPVHTVYLDAYWIDQTEVTNAMYAICVREGVCTSPTGNSEHPSNDFPVVYVSWTRAEQYCAWAGRRLPTEAEWEKAARGTDGRTYPWGEGIDCTMANYHGKNVGTDYCVGKTTVVGSYPDGASPYGALDMAGNVWEWVSDWYDSGYYSSSPGSNPPGPSFGQYLVLRGGSFLFYDRDVRSAFRFGDAPSVSAVDGGLRCATSN